MQVAGLPTHGIDDQLRELRAIASTSRAGSGGKQRRLFSARSAALIASVEQPPRRIQPPMLVSVVLRLPCGMGPDRTRDLRAGFASAARRSCGSFASGVSAGCASHE
jgi:hypothetical protein